MALDPSLPGAGRSSGLEVIAARSNPTTTLTRRRFIRPPRRHQPVPPQGFHHSTASLPAGQVPEPRFHHLVLPVISTPRPPLPSSWCTRPGHHHHRRASRLRPGRAASAGGTSKPSPLHPRAQVAGPATARRPAPPGPASSLQPARLRLATRATARPARDPRQLRGIHKSQLAAARLKLITSPPPPPMAPTGRHPSRPA